MHRKKILFLGLIIGFSLFAMSNKFYSLEATVSGFPTTKSDIQSNLSGSYFKEYSRFLSLSSEYFALSFASTDLIGQTKIKNFEVGVGFQAMAPTDVLSATAGSSKSVSVGDIGYGMGVGFGMAVHFGLAGKKLSDALKDFDFIFKGAYLPEIPLSGNMSISAFSVGFKPRWQIVKDVDLKVIGWGGLTLGLGFDYTKVDVKADVASQNITIGGTSGTQYATNLQDYTVSLAGNFVSISPELTTNVSILKFIVPYITAGVLVNLGNISVDGVQKGTILGEAGSITLSGEEKGKMFIPYGKAGIEFDLWLLQLTVQGQIAFATEKSYGLGFGVRAGF